MGAVTSKREEHEELLEKEDGGDREECAIAHRPYASPTVRKKRREAKRKGAQPPRTAPQGAPGDAVDKYDYLIVFKKVSSVTARVVDEESGGSNEDDAASGLTDMFSLGGAAGEMARVHWGEAGAWGAAAADVWFDAVRGDGERKREGVEALKRTWQAATRQASVGPGSSVSAAQFLNITREHIVNMLTEKTGLQLKMSRRALPCRDKGSSTFTELIFCRVRAPLSLLEAKASAIGRRLRFRPEVDPGFAFWARRGGRGELAEVNEERKLVETREEAAEALGALYRSKRIGPHDMHVFEDETTPRHWTRRLRTLERIADRVPVTNAFPPHAPFPAHRPSARHLFCEHPSARGSTLFLPCDRLALTRALLDEACDFRALASAGLVEAVLPLHGAGDGERVTRGTLTEAWALPWKGREQRVAGAPFVSSGVCQSYLRPWAQPFGDIREYFGEKVAMYFAWLGFYSASLAVPTVLGLLLEAYQAHRGSLDSAEGGWVGVAYTAAVACWAACYLEAWRGEQRACGAKWGTLGGETAECNRPEFHGDVQEKWFVNLFLGSQKAVGRRLSRVTLEEEAYYPCAKRSTKAALNALALTVILAALGAVLASLALLEYHLVRTLQLQWGAYVAAALAAALVPLGDRLVAPWSAAATNWENHQHDNAKIAKTFAFQLVNSFGYLAFTAFGKEHTVGCAGDRGSCIQDTRLVLMFVFLVRYIVFAVETFGVPCWGRRLAPGGLAGSGRATHQDSLVSVVVAMTHDPESDVYTVYCRKGNDSGGNGNGSGSDSGYGGGGIPVEAGDSLVDVCSCGLQALGFHVVTPVNAELFEAEIAQHAASAYGASASGSDGGNIGIGNIGSGSGSELARSPLLVELQLHLAPGPSVPVTTTILRTLTLPPPVDAATGHGTQRSARCCTRSELIAACDRAKDSASAELVRTTLHGGHSGGGGGSFEDEFYLAEAAALDGQYGSVALQFGLVASFSLAWGWAPLLAMVEATLQVRGDAYALLRSRRPEPESAWDVGLWQSMMDAGASLALYASAGLVCLTAGALAGLTLPARCLACLGLELCLRLLRLAASATYAPGDPLVQAEGDAAAPARLSEVMARQQFVVDRHLHPGGSGRSGGASNGSLNGSLVGAPHGSLDVDCMSLEGLGDALSRRSQAKVHWLAAEARRVGGTIDALRQSLAEVAKDESLNERTGVGESRLSPGLSLGSVTLQLLRLDHLQLIDRALTPQTTLIVVSFVDRSPPSESSPGGRPYAGDVGPPSVTSRPGTPASIHSHGRTVFNQEFRLAPVKSRAAELVLCVVDARTRRVRGTATVPLRDLEGQGVEKRAAVVKPRAAHAQSSLAQDDSGGGGGGGGDSDGPPPPEGTLPVLHVALRFKYSALAPLRSSLLAALELKRAVERDLVSASLGRDCAREWEWQGL